MLSIYFTNDWNPICKLGQEGYKDFVRRTQKSTHLIINSDKYPKLKWFFDCRVEPCLKIYYYGAEIKSIGGCNFDRHERAVNRSFEFINQNFSVDRTGHGKEYEMPYYKWESNLDITGNDLDVEATGSWQTVGWRGFMSYTRLPNEENYMTHKRLKK